MQKTTFFAPPPPPRQCPHSRPSPLDPPILFPSSHTATTTDQIPFLVPPCIKKSKLRILDEIHTRTRNVLI